MLSGWKRSTHFVYIYYLSTICLYLLFINYLWPNQDEFSPLWYMNMCVSISMIKEGSNNRAKCMHACTASLTFTNKMQKDKCKDKYKNTTNKEGRGPGVPQLGARHSLTHNSRRGKLEEGRWSPSDQTQTLWSKTNTLIAQAKRKQNTDYLIAWRRQHESKGGRQITQAHRQATIRSIFQYKWY